MISSPYRKDSTEYMNIPEENKSSQIFENRWPKESK